MSLHIRTKQMNIEIDAGLLAKAKASSCLSDIRLKDWVSQAIAEKLQREIQDKPDVPDQASELRKIMEARKEGVTKCK